MMRARLAFAAVALLAAPAAAPLAAQPVVKVDFSEYSSPTTTERAATFGAPLTSKGFDFYEAFSTGSRNVLGQWGTADQTASNRPTNSGSSVGMFSTYPGLELDMYVAGDDPFTPTRTFNLYSMDVAHLFKPAVLPSGAQDFPLQAFTLTFIGVYLDGSTTSQTFTIPAPVSVGGIQSPVYTTLNFSSAFLGVDNVFWNQNGSFLSQQHQFSNVVAQVTPEPSTYVLMVGGLAGVLLVARRRRSV